MQDDKGDELSKEPIEIIPEPEWTQPMHKQAMGRLKRPSIIHGTGVKVEFVPPRILGDFEEKAQKILDPVTIGHDLAIGKDVSTAAILRAKSFDMPITVIDEAHIKPMSFDRLNTSVRELSGNINMEFKEYEPMGNTFRKWVEAAHNNKIVEETDNGLTVVVYNVPWMDKSPEAEYLNSNPAFAQGAKLPRGKCTRKYGNKPIKKTKFNNCTFKAVQERLQEDVEAQLEHLTINMVYGNHDANKTIISK